MGQCITKLAAFMDGARGLRCIMGGDTARIGELAEELLQASFILCDLREVFGVCAVNVGL